VKQQAWMRCSPLGALIDERLAQAHECAQLEDVLGRNQSPRQSPGDQQLAQ
jgi:hypothetical protein